MCFRNKSALFYGVVYLPEFAKQIHVLSCRSSCTLVLTWLIRPRWFPVRTCFVAAFYNVWVVQEFRVAHLQMQKKSRITHSWRKFAYTVFPNCLDKFTLKKTMEDITWQMCIYCILILISSCIRNNISLYHQFTPLIPNENAQFSSLLAFLLTSSVYFVCIQRRTNLGHSQTEILQIKVRL